MHAVGVARMEVGGQPHAMRGLRQLANPLHNFAPCVWRCVRPATAAWRPGHALQQSDVRTRSQATAMDQQAAVSEPHTANDSNGVALPLVSNANAPTFQDAIARLQSYWSQFGCAICQPHNTEVGAGTMNPATYLRVNGPEPWNVCYVEPSIRPDDSRYGLNPNRLQRHTQLQVILKPEPGNPQELYLGSLEALGIDTRAHDVRFVEDNWESPVLGAWGLGWEVWLNGMEITQFTYFQQAGGRPLAVPAVEITYGLERILMSLQGVAHFKDIRYTDSITYGEMFMQNEYEMGRYNLDEADVATQRMRFELYEQEARRLLAKRLPVPAYDHLLKLSHVFNVMDARGAVGVTERQTCFATLRGLAREVTGLWMERRAELEHPLGLVSPPLPQPPPAMDTARLPAGAADFVLEVGTEELPPDDVVSACEQLRARVPGLLDQLRLAHGSVSVEGTPRRLAVTVANLAPSQPDAEDKVRGPPAKVAFGSDGSPSKALEGFCRKNAVAAADVTVEADGKGTEYVWAVVKQRGRAAAEVLAEELPAVLSAVRFKSSMRWRGDVAFSRPLRWLLALHGDAAVPLQFAGLTADRTTRVLRNSSPPQVQVSSAAEYRQVLQRHRIELDPERRADAIWEAVGAAAQGACGQVPASSRADLLPEVTNLVESPTAVLGTFDEAFLQLPREILVMVMRKHQRYFPVHDAGGALLPAFVTVANGAIDEPTVRAGNEAVLRARFEDAKFFYEDDLAKPLADFRPLLAGTVFHKQLGTLLDKSERVVQLVRPLAELTGLTEAVPAAEEAARLARADLATATVTESTALAGVMGAHFARAGGSPEAVAEAIFEAVLPRHAGDALPRTPAGTLVAIADRLDSVVGLTAAGCAPSASADPYALRRSAQGMLQTLLANDVRLDLGAAIDAAAALQPIDVTPQMHAQVAEFVMRRLEQMLVDGGTTVEAVRAALAERSADPCLAAQTARDLQVELDAGEGALLQRVMTSLARAVRLARSKGDQAGAGVDAALFEQAEEEALHRAVQDVRTQVSASTTVPDFLAAAEHLIGPVDAFFDNVFVMADDEGVRRNRLALLRAVAELPRGICDLTELPGF